MMRINIFSNVFHLRFRMPFECSYLVSCFILSSFLFVTAEACWGKTSPNYGDMTKDYDLQVGSELVLNCTLNGVAFPDFPRAVSSSDLVFEKVDQDFSNVTKIVDNLTIQLRIPNAKEEDSGFYYCKIVMSDEMKPVVCSSKISVGYFQGSRESSGPCVSPTFFFIYMILLLITVFL